MLELEDAIVGEWEAFEVEYGGSDDDEEWDEDEATMQTADEYGLDDAYLSFSDDGSFEGSIFGGAETGAWHAEDGQIILDFEDSEDSAILTLSNEGDLLVRRDIDEETGARILIYYRRPE